MIQGKHFVQAYAIVCTAFAVAFLVMVGLKLERGAQEQGREHPAPTAAELERAMPAELPASYPREAIEAAKAGAAKGVQLIYLEELNP